MVSIAPVPLPRVVCRAPAPRLAGREARRGATPRGATARRRDEGPRPARLRDLATVGALSRALTPKRHRGRWRTWARRLVWPLTIGGSLFLCQKAAVAGTLVAHAGSVSWFQAIFPMSDVLLLLFATTLAVPLMARLRTSPIVGFLLIGLVLGPTGFNLISHVDVSHRIAEFGIIFFLFETGLELSVRKVIAMRNDVFGLGMAQFFLTGGIIAASARWLCPRLHLGGCILMGGGLSLSSSAFALQLLRDKRQLGTRFGRASLGVLLFQDMAVVPLLVLAPLLSSHISSNFTVVLSEAFGKALLALGIIAFTGHFILQPLLAYVKRSNSSEAFLAVTLGTVLLSSSLTQALGLSETLGAFVGGVLVAETDYKHQIEADIAPFRGMLLGLFFVTVGFSFDVQLIANHWLTVIPLLLVLLLVKTLVVVALSRPSKLSLAASIQASALLAPGGEFALVLFRLAEQVGVLDPRTVNVLVTTTVLSMSLTPLLATFSDVGARRLRERRGLKTVEGTDEIGAGCLNRLSKDDRGFVVICGYNVVGRTICRLLDSEGEAQYVVFEDDVKTAQEDLDVASLHLVT
ncbi:unnamed protein product [Durusdinium trenchii]|uniref:Cation/H+ exchanger transmembrane domain-containing protein n=1 Tax=Durusdinium trenchii TaxID=1381693 RepID=A0ABP0J5J3_9DINO